MKWSKTYLTRTIVSVAVVPASNMNKLLYQKYYKQLTKNFHQSTEDEYRRSIAALNLLQSNAQDLNSLQSPQFLGDKLDKLRYFLSRCGLEIQHLEQQLSIIHVAGTKGKGSTCVFCESILQNYGFKTGFYSSPHLVSVRERIRVDGQPISRKKFSDCFWDVHKKLNNGQDKQNANDDMPPYFMYLTIMALKIFLEEKVDVAILEVGIGGEYDYTNILNNTAVVGISSLGLDHIKILGNTIEEIAFQKSGIMKPGCVAIASPDQPPAALKVLQKRAMEKKCSFHIAPSLGNYSPPSSDIRLGIEGPAQAHNASLAIQLVNAWMNVCKNGVYEGLTFRVTKVMLRGLMDCRWPGRTQLFKYSSMLNYYLDGAHTVESMDNCLSWFQKVAPASFHLTKRVLIFNMTDSREPRLLMKLFLPLKWDYVFFCPNRVNSSKEDLFGDNTNFRTSLSKEYERIVSYRNEWIHLHGEQDENKVKLFYDVLSVHQYLEQLSNDEKLHVLITGSLHLVGAFLTLLDPCLKQNYKTS